MKQNNKFSLPFHRASLRTGSVIMLGASLLAAACETKQFCSGGRCEDDGGGGDDGGASGGKPGDGGKPGTGGKGSASGGFGGELEGAGGALGGMGGLEPDATGGKANPDGSGGKVTDPGELEGSVAVELVDILAGGSAKVVVSLERSHGFKGIVLVSLDGEPFTGTQVFASASDDAVTLTIDADSATEQGYYEASVIAESSDGALSVEIPLNIRVRGAPGTLDLTFGDREAPWVGEGTDAEVAIDDAGFVYVRNEATIFRFDERGVLDESFEPEGLEGSLGPMIGMEDGVLVGTTGSSTIEIAHILSTGSKNPAWNGTGQLQGYPMSLGGLPWSLSRRDNQVAVAADYAYPASQIQLFSSTGVVDTSFSEVVFFNFVDEKRVRLDSQGRVLVAQLTEISRLLPNGSVDESFGDAGHLSFSGIDPSVLDFEVLSDDGLAILVEDDDGYSLAIWTPSDSGGVIQSYEAEYPRDLLALPNDDVLVVGRAYMSPNYYVRIYSRAGEKKPMPGPAGSINLNTLLMDSNPEASATVFVQEPVYDQQSNRIIITGLQAGTYLWSMWL